MDSSARFRRIFANRIAHAVGLGALVLPAVYACSGKAVVDPGAGGASSSDSSSNNSSSNSSSSNQTASGTGGASTTSGTGGTECTETSTTAAGGPNPTYHYVMCLDDLNTPCPSDEMAAFDTVQRVLDQECCVDFDSCETLRSVDCGPFATSDGQCCFEITSEEIWCAVPGRPFSDCGDALLADLAHSNAWLAAIGRIDCATLSPSERERLAAKWSRDGLAEHASVASFARFALQLMAVGAPAHLVAAAQSAALDEVEHARLAFAVASAYAGRDVGPGIFPVPSDGFATTLIDLAVATAEEGCINETLSTLEAQAELEATTDVAVRAVLQRIIEDETRHAELAWRTVAWAMRVGGDEVREAVAAVFARTSHSAHPAVREVIAPLSTSLLAA